MTLVTDPLLPTSSDANSSRDNRHQHEAPTQARGTPPALASHLAVAIAMTLGLILLNANYSFRNTKVMGGNDDYQRLASIIVPSSSFAADYSGDAALEAEVLTSVQVSCI